MRYQNRKGITLIALIVTIIVLIILAGVAISMLSGDSGILNRASEASVATEIGAFKERVSLAQIGLQADISSKSVSNPNYVATSTVEFGKLVEEVAKEIGVTPKTVGPSAGEINTEGYTVAGYLDVPGENGADGEGYITIWYTSNKLRSNIDRDNVESKYVIKEVSGDENRNQAILVSVIKITNYSSVLSDTGLTSINNGNDDLKLSKYGVNTEDGNKKASTDGVLGFKSGLTAISEEIEKISISPSILVLAKEGRTGTLKVTVTTGTGSNEVEWSSSDENIATVSSTGVVTAVAEGKATITATSKQDNAKSGSIEINVGYTGCYADINDDGTIDGVIFADLAKSESGRWNLSGNYNGYGVYSWTETTGLKNYYVKTNSHIGTFGTADIIAPVDLTEEGNDRFYIMALRNFTTPAKTDGTEEENYPAYERYCWYKNAFEKMSPLITSNNFGKGKENTRKMIEKWNSAGTTEGYTDSAQDKRDIWKHIQTKFNEGWFIPSGVEWIAFCGELGINNAEGNPKNYSRLGLSSYNWSSSQYNTKYAFYTHLVSGYLTYNNVNTNYAVRLATTF